MPVQRHATVQPIEPGNPGQSVTSKIMRILAAFSADHAELGPSEIARRSGLPYATAHRLLAELVRGGALDRTAGGRYSIGLRLWEIGSLTPHLRGLRSVAVPYMQNLRLSGRLHVQLNVLDGVHGLSVEKISPRPAGPAHENEVRFPLHATSGGQTLLAHVDPDRLQQALAAPLRRWTPHTITTPGQLRQVLAEVRRSGVAISSEQYQLGRADVAAPVFGVDGTLVGSLEAVMPPIGPRRHAQAVREAAAGLSGALRLAASSA
jgi:DNA-binding IclR family transcriptional regulator